MVNKKCILNGTKYLTISNVVWQGGLFAVYVDYLCKKVFYVGSACFMEPRCINHVCKRHLSFNIGSGKNAKINMQ